MPLYEYQCEKCGRFELVKKFSDAPVETCPTCGGPVEKLLSSPAIQFKGTGWYVTDYAKSGAKPGSSSSSAKPESKSEASKDSGGTPSAGKDSSSKDSSAKSKPSGGSGGGEKSGS